MKEDENQFPMKKGNQFTASRQKEISGLLEKGVFKLVQFEDIPAGARVFNSRFVDEIKNAGTEKAFEKSRLVVQAYNDINKSLVLTQSPTSHISRRILLTKSPRFTRTLFTSTLQPHHRQTSHALTLSSARNTVLGFWEYVLTPGFASTASMDLVAYPIRLRTLRGRRTNGVMPHPRVRTLPKH